MSLIIAYKEEEEVHVGFDSQVTTGDVSKKYDVKKAFFVNEEQSVVIGAVGYVAHLNVLEFMDDFTKTNEFRKEKNLKKYVFKHLLPKLKEEFEGLPFGDEEGIYENQIIVATKDEVVVVSGLLTLFSPKTDYICIGSGEWHADAVLETLEDVDIPIENKIIKALEVTANHVSSVGGPFQVLTITNDVDRTEVPEPVESVTETKDEDND